MNRFDVTDPIFSRLPAALAVVAGLLLALASGPAAAQDADRWMVRTHVSGVLLDAESEVLDLSVGNTVTLGADVTYFVTPRVAVNALAAFIAPEVEAGDEDTGVTNLGSVDALPPAVTVQYHFPVAGPVQPYLGAGGSWVHFFGETGVLDDIDADIDDGWGLVGQGGVNLSVTDDVAVMADARWVEILNDPEVDTALGVDELDFRHVILSAGVGFTF